MVLWIVILGVILLNVIIVKSAMVQIVALGVIMPSVIIPSFVMPTVVIVNGVGLCIIIVLSVVMFSGRSRPRTGDRRSDRRWPTSQLVVRLRPLLLGHRLQADALLYYQEPRKASLNEHAPVEAKFVKKSSLSFTSVIFRIYKCNIPYYMCNLPHYKCNFLYYKCNLPVLAHSQAVVTSFYRKW